MKTKLTTLMIMLFFATLSVKAQDDVKIKEKIKADQEAKTELILGLPKVSEKNLFTITGSIGKMNGIVFVQFCEDHKLALMYYNAEIYKTPEDVIKAFQEKNVIMPMLVKQGSFKEVKEMCAQ